MRPNRKGYQPKEPPGLPSVATWEPIALAWANGLPAKIAAAMLKDSTLTPWIPCR
jgi:hypothetical protein